jgi:hypothetical protein
LEAYVASIKKVGAEFGGEHRQSEFGKEQGLIIEGPFSFSIVKNKE